MKKLGAMVRAPQSNSRLTQADLLGCVDAAIMYRPTPRRPQLAVGRVIVEFGFRLTGAPDPRPATVSRPSS